MFYKKRYANKKTYLMALKQVNSGDFCRECGLNKKLFIKFEA